MKNKKFFWLVQMDHRLHVALLKIGAPELFIKEMLGFREMNKKLLNESFVYVGYDDIYVDTTWRWNSYDNGKGKDVFEKNNSIFKGEVNVEEYEIEAFKHITG
jgi:hypothetical protein